MFEDQLAAVQELLTNDVEFRQLHEEHTRLKSELNERGMTLDHISREKMKKQKLFLKDKMANKLQEFTQQ